MTDARLETETAIDPDERRRVWTNAGRGWGARATEWAYLFEPYARPANDLLLDRLDVSESTRFLDVACGSGLAANVAARRGASVSGLDASDALIDLARLRTPEADFRVGDMYDLPFDDACFDAVTSFNGIWNGCDAALAEVRRVLTRNGQFGMTYWGSFDRMGLLPYFATIIELSPPSHQSATMQLGETGAAAADMLERSHFEIQAQGTIDVTNEWPDVNTAVRALAAAGPAVPAIEAIGYDAFCDALRDIIAPLNDPHAGVRITSELGWVTAQPA
jgi:ubiquinone/menaquinone biosynthesis C-methylase UbiE